MIKSYGVSDCLLSLSNLLLLSSSIVTVVHGQPRPDFSPVPIYDDFFNSPEQFRRVHLHVLGLRDESNPRGGLLWRTFESEATLTVETFGNETGSTDYFPIGSWTFPDVNYNANTKQSNDDSSYLFEFDLKKILFYKINGTAGLTFTMREIDRGFFCDELLHQFDLPLEDFPQVGEGYVNFTRKSTVPSDYDVAANADLVFRIKIMPATEKYVEEEALLNITDNFNNSKYDGIAYEETVIELTETGSTQDYQDGIDKALLQSWRHVNSTQVQGAVLWVIGVNDVFMHPHVVDRLFFGLDSLFKLDLYVVNWRLNGKAGTERGWLTDANYWSQNAYGNYDVYNEDIQKSLDLMRPQGYDKVIGYGHSTGALLLLNYIIDNGDSSFDGLLLNSPLFDWRSVRIEEFYVERIVCTLVALRIWSNNRLMNQPSTPEGLTIIEYLGLELVMEVWNARLSTIHPSPWSWRKQYFSALPLGFLNGASKAQRKLERAAPVTSKPVFVMTSRGDDTLDTEEIVKYSTWASEDRELIQFNYNYHDVFFAVDQEDELDAIEQSRKWIASLLSGTTPGSL